MRHFLPLAAAALLALPACGDIAAVTGTAGPKVAVSGKLTVAKDQTALVAAGGGNIVAAGGLNYLLTALPGEGAWANVKLRITTHPGGLLPVPVQTDTAGNFKVELPGGAVYAAKTDPGSVPHVIVAGTAATSVTLDGANRLVAAKIFSAGKTVEGAKINDAIAKLRSSLSASPSGTDEASLAAEFDAKAGADVKAALGL